MVTDPSPWSLMGIMPDSQWIWGGVSEHISGNPLYIRSIVEGTHKCCTSLTGHIPGWRSSSNGFQEEAKKGNEVRERRVAAVGDRVIEVKRNREKEEQRQQEKELQELREGVDKLRNMKRKLETFVATNPELQKECSKALEKDPEGIDSATPVSLEDADERTRLVIEKMGLEYDLDVRMRFVMLHKDLYNSFKRHVALGNLPELEWRNSD